MHPYEVHREILELWEQGHNKKKISRMTGINRITIRDSIARYQTVDGVKEHFELTQTSPVVERLHSAQIEKDKKLYTAYAYTLGIYLGDGYIVRMRRTYRLRIALATAYPDIITRCIEKAETVLPHNKVSIVQEQGNYVSVSCYSNFLPDVFPQDGDGMKHERDIVLEDWQQKIVDTYPLEFWRGLYHSDGCRFSNVVKGKDYPRYAFTNTSTDIMKLFQDTCDKLGLHWTTKSSGRDTFVSRRDDVAYLDSVIGPKS